MEQNTDRMYWTIGIIVIGALVIAGALFLFKQDGTLFGAITEKITGAFAMTPAPDAPKIG